MKRLALLLLLTAPACTIYFDGPDHDEPGLPDAGYVEQIDAQPWPQPDAQPWPPDDAQPWPQPDAQPWPQPDGGCGVPFPDAGPGPGPFPDAGPGPGPGLPDAGPGPGFPDAQPYP